MPNNNPPFFGGYPGALMSKKRRALFCPVFSFAVGIFGGQAVAQQLPSTTDPNLDPEALRRETLQERNYFQNREDRVDPETEVIESDPPAQTDALPAQGPSFILHELLFTPSVFLEETTLAQIAEPYLGREVKFADLNRIVALINRQYEERGLVTAQAFIPPQRIEEGQVRITLVEGRLGEMALSGQIYSDPEFLQEAVPVETGAVIDLPEVSRSLRLFNLGNEVQLKASLKPGSSFGETNVGLQVREPPRNRFQVFSSNDGSRTTGEEQLGAVVVRNSILGRADQFSAFLVSAEGAVNGSLNYSLAVNHTGGRVGLGYSRNSIEIIQGGYENLDITGSSEGWNLDYIQPVIARDRWSLIATSSYSEAESITELSSLDVQLSESDISRLSVGIDWRYQGDGWQVQLFQNAERMESEEMLEDSQATTLYRGGGSWLQRTGERSYLMTAADWQITSQDVTPASALFQIGGVASVRGYDQGILSGSKGYSVNLSWHWQWKSGLEPFAFVDNGAVYAVSPDHEQITSAGLGLDWRWGKNWRGQLAYGHAFDEILPDQKDDQFHARLVWALDQ